MKWNRHWGLEGKHAFMSASKYTWINYDTARLKESWRNAMAKEEGTRLHFIASELIKFKHKMPKNKDTLNMFVNDAIGFRMDSEQILYYSENCFGTADAICFKDGTLRIHDLKTGITPTHMEQLMIYAALFCLEYDVKPGEIKMELRIYQNGDITVMNPTAEDILPIMDKIQKFDKIIEKMKEEEE